MNLFCLQTIIDPIKIDKDLNFGLVPISKSMFWTFGYRFKSYDNLQVFLNKKKLK